MTTLRCFFSTMDDDDDDDDDDDHSLSLSLSPIDRGVSSLTLANNTQQKSRREKRIRKGGVERNGIDDENSGANVEAPWRRTTRRGRRVDGVEDNKGTTDGVVLSRRSAREERREESVRRARRR